MSEHWKTKKKYSNTIWIYVTLLLSDHKLVNGLCKAWTELFVLFLGPCF